MSTVKTRGAKGAREPREPKLGVLGGMGPQATQVFYQYVLDRTEASCDQEHLPALILSDTGVPDRTASILTGNTEPMYQRLLADARLPSSPSPATPPTTSWTASSRRSASPSST